MITGIAIGYLLGAAVVFMLTFSFAACLAINNHGEMLAMIYDPTALDANAKDDPTRTKETGEKENGRRTDDSDPAGAGNKDE